MLLPWDAESLCLHVQTVDSVAVSSNSVYIGVTSPARGQPRSSIGAVDLDTGNALPESRHSWNTVQALAVSGNTLRGRDFPWIGTNGPRAWLQ